MGRAEREKRKAEQLEKQRQRQAKLGASPDPKKEARHVDVPDYEASTVQWCFELFDHATDWRDGNGPHIAFCEIGDQFKSYSRLTWAEIRANAHRDHPLACDVLCKRARDRLAELRLDDVDELWRFRFAAKRRVWGIRDGRVMKVLWWDPDHQVYPVEPKNT